MRWNLGPTRDVLRLLLGLSGRRLRCRGPRLRRGRRAARRRRGGLRRRRARRSRRSRGRRGGRRRRRNCGRRRDRRVRRVLPACLHDFDPVGRPAWQHRLERGLCFRFRPRSVAAHRGLARARTRLRARIRLQHVLLELVDKRQRARARRRWRQIRIPGIVGEEDAAHVIRGRSAGRGYARHADRVLDGRHLLALATGPQRVRARITGRGCARTCRALRERA